MEHNKLVRDNIPEIIEQSGRKPVIRVLEDGEYLQQLHKKLQEEIREFFESGETEELCDIAEVVEAIAAAKGVSKKEFQEMKEEKAKRNGRFERRIFLVRTQ